jgi:hypothetical protein
MTKIMNICDSVTTSTVRGRRPHFRDSLIEENILYFTLIWGFFTTIPHVSEISASEHEIGRM